MAVLRFFVSICVLITSNAAFADCATSHLHITGPFGVVRFETEIADTPELRQRGLMFRDHISHAQSMIFVFPKEQPQAFWMKNTLIPLDIMYFDAAGHLVNIAADAVPGDLTPLPSAGPAQFVVEIQGGLAKKIGIRPGAVLEHAAVKKTEKNVNCLQ